MSREDRSRRPSCCVIDNVTILLSISTEAVKILKEFIVGKFKILPAIGYIACICSLIGWGFLIWYDPYYEGMNQVSPMISFSHVGIPRVFIYFWIITF